MGCEVMGHSRAWSPGVAPEPELCHQIPSEGATPVQTRLEKTEGAVGS